MITARRGDAAVAAETEFNEDDIAAEGSDNIGALLSSLQPFIDPGGAAPVILINGKPAGSDTSIFLYPVEALTRVAVLKPEAAARYGAKPGSRVVNLVLKPKFASIEAEAGANAATAGGQWGASLGATRSAIAGDTRWSARARYDRQSMLRKSARGSGPRADQGSDGAPLPALAEENGRSDDLSAAGAWSQIDPDDFVTLQPASHTATFGVNVARPLGTFMASLSVDVVRSASNGLRGIPTVSLAAPSGEPSSPEGGAISLERPFAGGRALVSENDMQSLAASMTLSGLVRGVQANLIANISKSDSHDLVEAADVARLQQLIELNPDFDPFAPVDEAWLNVRRNRSRATNMNVSLNLQKSALRLPAGPISWNASANVARARSVTWQGDKATLVRNGSTQVQSSAQVTVNVPISSPGSSFGALGDLAADASFNRLVMTNSGSVTSYGGGVSWAPIERIQLRGSIDRAASAPTFNQLNDPISTTTNRIFDYAREEFVDPVWTTGGNPALVGGSQTIASLSMTARPLSRQELTLNVAYRQLVAKDGPAPFPDLTPAIEAAFPERITRDSTGRLLAIDARPINIARQKDASLNTNITLRLGGPRRRKPGEMGLNLAADRVQVNLALSHRLRLRSESLIRRGLPVIDRLAESGAPRHEADFRLSVSKRAFGGTLSTNWSSPTRIAAGEGTFRLTPPLMFNLSSFADIGRLSGAPQQDRGWTRGLKISFDIQNLFNGYRRITLPGGGAPAGYSRDEVNPLGRTVQLTIRKQF